MKTRTVIEREGEKLGPIDWSYDFQSHAWGPNRGGTNPECVTQAVANLKQVETWMDEGKVVEIYLYSMWVKVLDIGMYDGWPYWRPVPSVCTETWLGGEWHDFTKCWAGVRVVDAPSPPSPVGLATGGGGWAWEAATRRHDAEAGAYA